MSVFSLSYNSSCILLWLLEVWTVFATTSSWEPSDLVLKWNTYIRSRKQDNVFCHAPDISKIPTYFGKVVFFLTCSRKRERWRETERKERWKGKREGGRKKEGKRKGGKKKREQGREGWSDGGKEWKKEKKEKTYFRWGWACLCAYSFISRAHIHPLTSVYSSLQGWHEFCDGYGND